MTVGTITISLNDRIFMLEQNAKRLHKRLVKLEKKESVRCTGIKAGQTWRIPERGGAGGVEVLLVVYDAKLFNQSEESWGLMHNGEAIYYYGNCTYRKEEMQALLCKSAELVSEPRGKVA